MESIFEYNFFPDFSDVHNVQMVFAVNHEGGMVIGTWPKGDRPRIPFVYADEVWTGVEYEAATNMIWTGLVEEGLEVVRAVRQRYRGFNRNPWGEIESGMYYARAMASWSLLLALSGFEYDGIQQHIQFDPKVNQDNFSTFWSCGQGWGNYKQNTKQASIKVQFGELLLKSIKIPFKMVQKVMLGEQEVTFKITGNTISFEQPISISEGNTLNIHLVQQKL
jgi:hypothetical protein